MFRTGSCGALVLTALVCVHGCGGGGDSGDDEPSIPKQWPAPGDACGELGNDCSSCDGAEEICYATSPEICTPVPKTAISARCWPGMCAGDTPYCIAENCVTLEQATCMCAGSVGSNSTECKKGPAFAAGVSASSEN